MLAQKAAATSANPSPQPQVATPPPSHSPVVQIHTPPAHSPVTQEEVSDTEQHLTPTSSPLSTENDYLGGNTEYDKHYETLQSIGKGAFGFVKLARRVVDDEEVSDVLLLTTLTSDPNYLHDRSRECSSS